MDIRMTFRHSIMAAAFLAAAVVSCDDAAQETPAPAGDSAAATTTTPASSAPMTPAGADEIVLDSIPLRTPEGKPARYGWRSGHVVYRYSGGLSGRREIHFTDWGMTERRYDSTVPVGTHPVPPQHVLMLTSMDAFTQVDIPTKKGWTLPNDSDEEYLASDSGKIYSLGELLFRNSGGTRKPDEVVKGVTAHVVEMNQGFLALRVWVHQGLIIKEHFKTQDGTEYFVEVESMEFDVDVPASMFTLPAGYSVEKKPKGWNPSMSPPPGTVPPPGAGPGGPPGGMPPGGMPPGGMAPGGPPGAPPPGAGTSPGPMTRPGAMPPPGGATAPGSGPMPPPGRR
jgi:hypothetical protein